MNENTHVFSRKIENCMHLIAPTGTAFVRALVVGCGSGEEARELSTRFNCDVDGIDLWEANFETIDNDRVRLHVMDAAHMSFPDATFDLLYSFHALEHIEELDAALSEMRRVLKPDAVVFIGTPNKSRAFGYVGSATTLKMKLIWNLHDLLMRLRGRWENKYGAHAGFTARELQRLVASTFGPAVDVTLDYYLGVYAKHAALIRLIHKTGLHEFLFPAVYVRAVVQNHRRNRDA
jgi:ubiquinone/menaquinone biosynthesis C-methylase UbiE